MEMRSLVRVMVNSEKHIWHHLNILAINRQHKKRALAASVACFVHKTKHISRLNLEIKKSTIGTGP